MSDHADLLRRAAARIRETAAPPLTNPSKIMLAVAEWLESWGGVDLDPSGPLPTDYEHAVNVARAVLGEETTE